MTERFWKWLTGFDARRFMYGTVAAALLCLGTTMLLVVYALRIPSDAADTDALGSGADTWVLPEVPRLPDMTYAAQPEFLYRSTYLSTWLQKQRPQKKVVKKPPLKPTPPPPPPPQPPPKKKPEKKVTLRYAGTVQNTQGQQLVLVDDPQTRTTRSYRAGDVLYGWTIREIYRTHIILVQSDRAPETLPRGAPKSLTVTEP